MYPAFLKPLLDKVVSLLLLLITSPIILLTVFLLAIVNGGKVWFTQLRPGRNGKIFKVIKFKTMTDSKDADGNPLPDEQRMTRLGKFIRATSIDELPQLINVLQGDMSIVGPRPLLMEYLEKYNDHQRKRHLVKPGITGWAQVNGRNAISWDSRFDLDVWYVEHLSFLLDLKILLLTFLKVLKSEGISSSSSVTMEKFNGTK